MFIPLWLLIALALLAITVFGWTVQLALGRNPFPFPDPDESEKAEIDQLRCDEQRAEAWRLGMCCRNQSRCVMPDKHRNPPKSNQPWPNHASARQSMQPT